MNATNTKEREALLNEIIVHDIIIHPEIVALYHGASILTRAQRDQIKGNHQHDPRWTKLFVTMLLSERVNYYALMTLTRALDTSHATTTAVNAWMRSWLKLLENNTAVTMSYHANSMVDWDKDQYFEFVHTHPQQQQQQLHPCRHPSRQPKVVFYPHYYQRHIPLAFKRSTVFGSRLPYHQHFDCNLYLQRDLGHATIEFQSNDVLHLQPPLLADQRLLLFCSFITFEVYL